MTVLHSDEADRGLNLTAEEYAKTYYDEGTTGGHEIPEDVLKEALEALEKGKK